MFLPSLLLVSILTLITPSFSVMSKLPDGYPDQYPDPYPDPHPEPLPGPYPVPYPDSYVPHPASKPHQNYGNWNPRTTSPSASPTSMANNTGLRTTASPTAPPQSTSAAAAASHRGSGDPCGPTGNQTDFESTLNTCGAINTTYTDAPSEYGVQCLNAYPSLHQIMNLTSCTSNIENMCDLMARGQAKASQWNWSSGGPNCTVGVWFNPAPAAQAPTSSHVCENYIFQLMRQTCFPTPGGSFDVAAVNLRRLPDESSSGSQVDVGYPSYIMVPETYDDIYDDAGGGSNEGDGSSGSGDSVSYGYSGVG